MLQLVAFAWGFMVVRRELSFMEKIVAYRTKKNGVYKIKRGLRKKNESQLGSETKKLG